MYGVYTLIGGLAATVLLEITRRVVVWFFANVSLLEQYLRIPGLGGGLHYLGGAQRSGGVDYSIGRPGVAELEKHKAAASVPPQGQ